MTTLFVVLGACVGLLFLAGIWGALANVAEELRLSRLDRMARRKRAGWE